MPSDISRRSLVKTLATFPLLRSLPAPAQHLPAPQPHPAPAAVHLNARDFGATGDGHTKDTFALQQALDRCTLLGGGELRLPPGQYLTGTLILRSNTTLYLDEGASLLGSPDLADYPLTQVRWEGRWIKGYSALLTAWDATHIVVTGKGEIVGSSAIKGRVDRTSGLRHPALLEFTACSQLEVRDCITRGNDMWSIHPVYCDHITFQNLVVNGGADGIDIDSCKHVLIDQCTFNTADDCISLKSGRGEEGNTLHRPTEDVVISNCTFHDLRWACIGIGSETSSGIRDVRVEHCKCLGAGTFAIYIKSRPGRGAFLENLAFTDLDVSGAKLGFLRINLLDSGKQDEFPVPGDEGIPLVRNISFSHVRVTDEATLVEATSIHPGKPLHGLTLADISGTCAKGIYLANITGADIRDVHVTGLQSPLLNTHNVTGKGLAGASPIEGPAVPAPIAAPAQGYTLQ